MAEIDVKRAGAVTSKNETAAHEARVTRLHHITGVAASPQANHDFYTQVLGLRLVKQTVNFDDPSSYHLYYGDRRGAPGTALTFFPWPDLPRGAPGLGQAVLTQFSAPADSLSFWERRLSAKGVRVLARETVFAGGPLAEERLVAQDPDGAAFALVAVPADADARAGGADLWTTSEIGPEVAIRGFHGVTLAVAEAGPMDPILTQGFGYRAVAEEAASGGVDERGGRLIRYQGEGPGSVLDIHEAPGLSQGRPGAGVTHHVAFSTPDRATQQEVRRRLTALGHPTTRALDRGYFTAIYFRTPGGVLFEVATEEPGFDVDEPVERLGERLMLPEHLEPRRAEIAAALPPLTMAPS
ncbi:MAG: ring-cleaving dioxygenase [Pseudomonadota bacterium]